MDECVILSSASGQGENGVTASNHVGFHREADMSIHVLQAGRLCRDSFGGFLFFERGLLPAQQLTKENATH